MTAKKTSQRSSCARAALPGGGADEAAQTFTYTVSDDNNALFTAGQTRHFQTFYRELTTAGCMTALNTSQAVSLTYTP